MQDFTGVPGPGRRFPALVQFFGGYLNQDWPDDYDDVWAAVAHFLQEAVDEELSAVITELAALLRAAPSEEELTGSILAIGCYYWPPGSGESMRDWVVELLARLEAAR